MGLFLQIVTGLLLVFAVLFLRTYLERQQLSRKHGCKSLPSLTGRDPTAFGLDLVFLFLKSSKRGLENLTLGEQFDALGSTFRTQRSIKPIIRTIDPRNIQAIFVSDAASYGVGPLRHFSFGPLIGDGVMTLDGVRHQKARALIQPTFSKSHIDEGGPFSVHVENLIKLLPTDGSTVDLQPLFERLDLDSSTEVIFGETVSSLTSDSLVDPHKFAATFSEVQTTMGARFQMPPFNFLHRDKVFWEGCRTIRQIVAGLIDQALLRCDGMGGKDTRSYVLVDNLVRKMQNRAEIRDALMNVFLPAHDTRAILLSNIFFQLARHPDVWTKLRQRILEVPELTVDALKRVDYLQYVINETLRLTPPVSNMSRIALKDTVLPSGGGPKGDAPVLVAKGTIMSSAFYYLHRNQDVYGEDAEHWRPERWENLKLSELTWQFVPFGGGPHVCPGQNLSMNNVSFTLARLVQIFGRIENRDPVEEFIPVYKLVTESQNGAKVALYPA
ncbi:MAG: hypothetical protein M1818_008404 [Claussenomyces sp. TS43310]|nr:MAG: hypothetical protein M1818_008404 [Claussenomyces sp. TS43310]